MALVLLPDARMTHVIALSLAITIASPSFADEVDDARTRARQMRKTGAGIMGVGLIHLTAGLAMSIAIGGLGAQCENKPFPCGEGLGIVMIPAFTLLASGGLITGVGMPMYFVGRKRERRLRQLALIPTPIGQLTPVPPMPQ